MTITPLQHQAQELQSQYEQLCARQLNLDLTRGKPSAEQLDIADVMDGILQGQYHLSDGTDLRNYGGLDGIVTMEDIIETLLGLEIVDEKDAVSDMQEYARKRWKARQAKYNLLEKLDNNNEPSSDNIMIT
jgi:hypothetical protein